MKADLYTNTHTQYQNIMNEKEDQKKVLEIQEATRFN